MNDRLAHGEDGNLLELPTRDSELLRASSFLYPRWRVSQELLGDFYQNLHKLDKDESLRFLTVYEPEAAKARVREAFAQLREYYDEHPPEAWHGGPVTEFGDWHVPYVVSEEELADGVDLYYRMLAYIQMNHEIEPQTVDGERFGLRTNTGETFWIVCGSFFSYPRSGRNWLKIGERSIHTTV